MLTRIIIVASTILLPACIFGDTSCDLDGGDQGALSCDFGHAPPVCSCEPKSDDEAGDDYPDGPYQTVYRVQDPVHYQNPYDGVIAEVNHDASYVHTHYDAIANYVDTFPTQVVQHAADIMPTTEEVVTCAQWTSSYPCFQAGHEVLTADPFQAGAVERDAFAGNWCRTCLAETMTLDPLADTWIPALDPGVHLARPCYAIDNAVQTGASDSVSQKDARWQWLSVHSARWEDFTEDIEDGCGSDHRRPASEFGWPTLPMWCLTADQGCNGLCNDDADCEWMYSLHTDGYWPEGEAICENWPITRKWDQATFSFIERPHGCFWSTLANGGEIPPLPMPGGWLPAPVCDGMDCEVSQVFYDEAMANLGRATVGVDWRWSSTAVVITRVAEHSTLSLPLEVGDSIPVSSLAYAAWTMAVEGWADINIERASGRVVLSLTIVD